MVYSDIWTMDKQDHLNKFKSGVHTADTVDKKIMLYDVVFINEFYNFF